MMHMGRCTGSVQHHPVVAGEYEYFKDVSDHLLCEVGEVETYC